MGTVFKKQTTRAFPVGAEIITKNGKRLARWRVGAKLRTAPLTRGENGSDRILTESATYFAKYRDASGKQEIRATGCRDKQAAEQLLKKWEREVEQVKAGTLDSKALGVARQAAVPLEEHLATYEQSLIAAGVSRTYRANVLRAVRRVAKDCEFETPAEFNREAVEKWLAARVTGEEKMSARSRNYYRESLVAFPNWCVQTGRLLGHDLHRVPKSDQRADPRRQRRALTEDELVVEGDARRRGRGRGGRGSEQGEEDDQSWRRIDGDWLRSSEQFALRMSNYINNTSLVLAIELPRTKKVLLFVGDAQRGNWVSWHERDWTSRNGLTGGEKVTMTDLLSRTVFYKVGHHGSHNATMNEGGLREMAMGQFAEEFVAMIPANQQWAETMNKPPWHHPLKAIYEAILEKAKGRVFVLDRDLKRPTAQVMSEAEWDAFLKKSAMNDLFYEVTVED